jgi:hypothetical protein
MAAMTLALFFGGLLLLAIMSLIVRSFRRASQHQEPLEPGPARLHGFLGVVVTEIAKV